MSKINTHELDLQIQLSLVAKIRQAAHRYKTANTDGSSEALQTYIASLEGLAEHIETKCRGRMLAEESALAHKKAGSESRVIAFPASGASPLTAA